MSLEFFFEVHVIEKTDVKRTFLPVKDFFTLFKFNVFIFFLL